MKQPNADQWGYIQKELEAITTALERLIKMAEHLEEWQVARQLTDALIKIELWRDQAAAMWFAFSFEGS